MDDFDARMAARVWQRVRSAEPIAPAGHGDIRELLFQSHNLTGIYLGLQRRFTGRANTQIRALYRQHRDLAACLKGMLLASGDAIPGLPPMTPGSGTLQAILSGCFHQERRLGEALSRQAGDPGFGPVCQFLAGQSVRRAAAVLGLLGDMEAPE